MHLEVVDLKMVPSSSRMCAHGEQTNSFFQEIPTIQVRCDFKNGGEWTVILRRNANVTEQVSFDHPWADYERGFGDLNTEFWYGLCNMHCLLQTEVTETR